MAVRIERNKELRSREDVVEALKGRGINDPEFEAAYQLDQLGFEYDDAGGASGPSRHLALYNPEPDNFQTSIYVVFNAKTDPDDGWSYVLMTALLQVLEAMDRHEPS